MNDSSLPNLAGQEARRIIDLMGGTGSMAAFFDLSPSSVSDWRHAGIPRARMRHLRDVRPDLFRIWPELVGTPGAPDIQRELLKEEVA